MSNASSFPRIIISAPKSGSGKTVLTIALMKALTLRGKSVAGFKCGPDYIDPLFHQKILGIPTKNLDLFFTSPEKTRFLFARNNHSDISVIEGVMGLYDGLGGTTSQASTYDLAVALQAPIVLILDAKGASYSLTAEIKGFLSLDTEHLISAVILNNISGMFYQSIKPVIEKETGVKVLGYLPRLPELQLESRYLGLQLPDEIADIQERAEMAGRELERSVEVDAIMGLAQGAGELSAAGDGHTHDAGQLSAAGEAHTQSSGQLSAAGDVYTHDAGQLSAAAAPDLQPVRIAVARDEAFCFYYEDNLRLLEKLGAQLIPFSPVHDASLPTDVVGLLLGGGYPELCARQLSENTTMRNSIRAAIDAGMPSLAECGGFMYLHDSLVTQDGSSYEMAGVISGSCSYTGKLVRFGYVTVQQDGQQLVDGQQPTDVQPPAAGYTSAGPTGGLANGTSIRGHEFHYFDSSNNGADCTAVKPVTGRSWQCCHVAENHWWGFPHLYYESNPDFARTFIQQCRMFKESVQHGR